jgi:N6-adenosine-specific RNA methylase IME4
MSVEAICALPVASLATPDAHLYLWTVNPLMDAAFKVIEAWGFTHDTLLTWCKPGPGLGAGFRSNTEHLIVARRGTRSVNPTCSTCGGRLRGASKCSCADPDWRFEGSTVSLLRPFAAVGEGSWFTAPRGLHSQKPALFGDLIERMSPGPYVELFARSPRLGWASWGYGWEQAS